MNCSIKVQQLVCVVYVGTYVHSYWHMHDSGHVYMDAFAYFFTMIF